MTRLLINEGIKHKAEEDLMRLLLGNNLEPNTFNYSPFILRCVNEKLLENGVSLGLGYLSNKEIINKYWKDLSLPIEHEVVLRVVDSEIISQTIELVVLVKNHEIKMKIWDKLNEIKKLNPKNDRIYRGSFVTFTEKSAEEILDEIITILDDCSLSYTVEKFTLTRNSISYNDLTIDFILPDSFHYTCKHCNMCELPSNYSINPIPNQSNQPFCDLFSERRIGFPSNMVSTSVTEVLNINSETKIKMEDIALPILFTKKISGEIADTHLALRQNEGICTFQNLETKMCTIHDFKPQSCRNYPFMVSEVDEKHFLVEVDFSCPGLSTNNLSSERSIVDEILSNIVQSEQTMTELTRVQFNKWDISKYYADKTRVRNEDIKTALDYVLNEYKNPKDN
ncbi:MAG: YkgJ family cysteine cluster protein [Candidatus Heimdallarchaeaceae archaeon]